jgi:hypothetical protein
MNGSLSMYLPFSNWSLRPWKGETARGYFLRLVRNEGHHSTAVYGNEIGINGRRLTNEEALETLLTLPIGEDHKESLRRFTPQANGSYYDLAGQRLRQRQLTVGTRRFCRACLADAPYHRAWWDILSFRTCPEHGTLVEDTDAEGQPIGWWWADIASDTTGMPLARPAPSKVEMPRGVLESFVLARFSVVKAAASPLLERYQLYEVIEACEYLGMWLGNNRTNAVPADPMENLDIGMAAISGSWADLVDSMRRWFVDRVPLDVRQQGKMESMGWAWKAWPKLPGTSIGDMLQRATTEAFEPVGRMGKRRFRATADFYAIRALTPFARDFGAKVDAVLPLARHLGIVPAAVAPWELDENGIAALKQALRDLVPSSSVSDILGYDTWDWQLLSQAGIITAFSHFAMGRMYLRPEVEKVLESVRAKAATSESSSISLRTYARRHGVPLGEVFIKILDGRLPIVRGDERQPGLRSLGVAAKSRRRGTSRSISDNDAPEAVTAAEAASSLQLYPEVVSLLAGLGKLQKLDLGMVSRRSVMAFRKRYANAQIYRPLINCHNVEVRDRLEKLGVMVESFGTGVSNIIVEREAARRALGLQCDPDDDRIASSDLWGSFRKLLSVRCPVFTLPLTVPEIGVKLRTATRKIAVDATFEKGSGAITLKFDLHPELTSRRWKLFEKNKAEIQAALGAMNWKRSGDQMGWRLTLLADDADGVGIAVEVMISLHRWFK